MDAITVCLILSLGGVIFGFLGYKTITDSIIRDRDHEIRVLKRENARLKIILEAKQSKETRQSKDTITLYTFEDF